MERNQRRESSQDNIGKELVKKKVFSKKTWKNK